MMRLFLIVLALLPACKTRDPDAAGLLSDGTKTTVAEDSPKAGGHYALRCQAQDPEITTDTFLISVYGAVSATDEGQPLIVSLDRRHATVPLVDERIATKLPGRGLVRAQGAVFVGFAAGLLTAEFNGPAAKMTHTGLLTLAKDPELNGIGVDCQLTAER